MASSSDYRLEWVSDFSIRIILGDRIDAETSRRVAAIYAALRAAHLPDAADITPAYATISIDLLPLEIDFEQFEMSVREIIAATAAAHTENDKRYVDVPVCYDAEFAPDLGYCSSFARLTRDEFIRKHTGATFTVAFLGFSPGFAYLSGLPDELSVPRLDAPRTLVPAGSVGVAGTQTGVYPQATPGGWRIIGRTPLRMFNAARAVPALLTIGDKVRFVPISQSEFRRLESGDE